MEFCEWKVPRENTQYKTTLSIFFSPEVLVSNDSWFAKLEKQWNFNILSNEERDNEKQLEEKINLFIIMQFYNFIVDFSEYMLKKTQLLLKINTSKIN